MTRKKKASAAGGRGLRGFYAILAGVALVGIIAIGYAMRSGGKAATELVELDGVEDARALYEKAQGVVLGDASAPVKIVEFGDFQCPSCRSFALQVKPALVQNFIETGKAQFIYYDFPLTEMHAHAFLAARAGRCAADAGQFWAYHDLMYARQSNWAYERNAPVSTFAGYAEELGLDRGAFEQCLESDRHADVVTANRMLGERLGVNGTPTLIIDNKRVRNAGDFNEIARLIEPEQGG